MSTDTTNDYRVTIHGGKCLLDGFDLNFRYCDSQSIHFVCSGCGRKVKYVFQSSEEAQAYLQEAKNEILGKVKSGLVDPGTTKWEQLHQSIVDFIAKHPCLENDAQIQMGIVACLTNGFCRIIKDKYEECNLAFAVADRIFKTKWKALKEQSENPVLPEWMQEYREYRKRYQNLRNEYLESSSKRYKFAAKAIKAFFKL